MTALLELRDATKTFELSGMFGRRKTVEAMRSVSLSLEPRRALAVVGESGSGKSTIGRAVTGLFRLTSGQILFRGEDVAAFNTRQRRMEYLRSVQMVFQDPFAALNPAHTVRHHLQRPIAMHRKLRGAELEAAVRDTLSEVELDPDENLTKYPHELSGGQRQRINLARALAVGAELIVADEPTSMLDVSIRRAVLDLMARLKAERGLALLYITHDIATARHLAEDTAVMFAGQIVEWGPSERIIRDPRHPYTRVLLSAVPNPSRRFTGEEGQGLAFSREVERVRELSRKPAGPALEVSPGHFVRHAESAVLN
jgi:peptide/nickel transport system ATP-binding protein